MRECAKFYEPVRQLTSGAMALQSSPLRFAIPADVSELTANERQLAGTAGLQHTATLRARYFKRLETVGEGWRVQIAGRNYYVTSASISRPLLGTSEFFLRAAS